MRDLVILGSTGSIGTQTLDVVRAQGGFRVRALCAGKNIRLLEAQIREFHPDFAAVWDETDAAALRTAVADLPVQVLSGMDGLLACVRIPSLVVTAIVGMIGVRPTVAAIEAGNDIALANKETLVTAGHIIMPLAKEKGVSILPVDSEHSAIFQSLQGNEGNDIARILLTASGGPFRGRSRADLEKVTPADALKHPNWSMGAKITIDSASMVNKGLEVMEARWLFDVDYSQIQVLVHPQSIVHSAVEYADGAVIAQMGVPDMKLPIQYAMFYPKRLPMQDNRLDLCALGQLTFEEPDLSVFSGLALAYEAIRRGGNAPTVFNAANEEAVADFLAGRIGFLDIYDRIEQAMDTVERIEAPTLDEVLYTEQRARALFH